MNAKTYCSISATLFTLVAIAHLTRIFLNVPIQVDAVMVPMMISYVGFLIPGSLAFLGFREARKTDEPVE